MIPDASNIAQAAQLDEHAFREIDLSMRTDLGWVTCGRYRTYAYDEDIKGKQVGGFWICHAIESDEDSEWIMNLATCRTPFELYLAIEKIGIVSEHFNTSLTYLIYGTTDTDVIASLTKSGEEE